MDISLGADLGAGVGIKVDILIKAVYRHQAKAAAPK